MDILDTPKEYIFFMDVPGLSKFEIQVLISASIRVAPPPPCLILMQYTKKDYNFYASMRTFGASS